MQINLGKKVPSRVITDISTAYYRQYLSMWSNTVEYKKGDSVCSQITCQERIVSYIKAAYNAREQFPSQHDDNNFINIYMMFRKKLGINLVQDVNDAISEYTELMNNAGVDESIFAPYSIDVHEDFDADKSVAALVLHYKYNDKVNAGNNSLHFVLLRALRERIKERREYIQEAQRQYKDLTKDDLLRYINFQYNKYNPGYDMWQESFAALGFKISSLDTVFFHGIGTFIARIKDVYDVKIVPFKKSTVNENNQKPEMYKIKVFSRHPSHNVIRDIRASKRILVRFGSITAAPQNKSYIELNKPEAVANSASKFRMKELFTHDNVKTATWIIPTNQENLNNWIRENEFSEGTKFITKSEFGSRGVGLKLHNSAEELQSWLSTGNRFGRYLVERYYPYVREYRLHVSKNGCFYTCRKMLRSDIPADRRWFRNDSNSVWILEENEAFDKPSNWDTIVSECVKALNSVGLDLGACDIRVQSSDKKNPDFIICEINSAPSFGELTAEHYINEIQKLVVA